ncbi:Hypp5669 [Branchiostoma lanceolatum]|uniref:Hypp5669 protein n=1 Tax=Branchiostoma lanceolatum TaxID=7740 RepID=A0A8J9YRI2_BRALA|nr:Hypp5669 [Branchiostoma lanceolatum]
METLPTAIRVLCGLYFVYSSFVWSAGSLLSLVLFAASIFLLRSQREEVMTSSLQNTPSPRQRKFGNQGDENIPRDVEERCIRQILDIVCYDAMSCRSLESFTPVKEGTECVFARLARLWGSADWNGQLSLEENTRRSLPMFVKFCAAQSHLGLDGFLFELPGNNFGATPEDLGNGVRRLLKVLSDTDPAGVHCMDKSYVSKRGWCFEFDKCTFFVTTFAPCYPDTHSRFNFNSENSFVLLQPEESFLRHNVGADTPHTDWENPRTVRDQIRAAYRRAGRVYSTRDTVVYPPAHDIVKPLGGDNGQDNVVAWWAEEKSN